MSRTLTIRLDRDLERLLERTARDSGMKRSDLVRDALRRQLTLREFERLRRAMVPRARKRGIITDEDVFKVLS